MTGHPSIRLIAEVVAEHAGISYLELVSQRRKQEVTRARMIVAGLARRLTPQSFPMIGMALGGRDHTTAQHAAVRFEAALAVDHAFADEVAGLEEAVITAAASLKRLGVEPPADGTGVPPMVSAFADGVVAAANDLKQAIEELLGAAANVEVTEADAEELAATADAIADAAQLRQAAKAVIAALAGLDAASLGSRHELAAARSRLVAARADLCRAISPPDPDPEEETTQ